MISIKRKFFLAFILLMSLGIIISGVLSISLLKSNYEESVKNNLIENAEIIKQIIESNDNDIIYNNIIKNLKDKINSRVTLINKIGEVILDTEVDISTLDNHKERLEVKEALQNRISTQKRYSKSVKNEMYYVALPVESELIKVIRLSIPLKHIKEYSDSIVGNIVIATLVGIVLSSLLSMRFLNMFTGPLDELTEATRDIARGNYGSKVRISTNDEIGELADSFNIMSTELDNRIDELKESNMTNRAILKSMINGVIAVDNDYNIMFVNKAAQKMFGIEEKLVKNRSVREVFKGHILEDLFFKKTLLSGEVQSELEIKEPVYKVYRVFSNVIRDREKTLNTMGLLMNFVDITQMRSLENMRKDFVANVSHELKTPLTSIQGFIETLKEGAAEEKEIRDRFIDIIDIEANRLKLLIDDILVLSDIEKSTTTYSRFSDININILIEDITGMMESIAVKENIKIEYDVQKNMNTIFANSIWIKQMFVNLIDNSIKYSKDKGNVLVIISEEIDNFNIVVKDDGIGIEQEHLERLFERFYRVDKARSKKVGGTGLGLAIVKHIVLSLNGEINVESEYGKGTKFTIVLPKKNI